MSFEMRLYYFACTFLWCLLSLEHYFREEVLKVNTDRFYFERSECWAGQYNRLADWTLAEMLLPVKNRQIEEDESKFLESTAPKLGDSLIFHWSSLLQTAADDLHKQYSNVGKSTWLYYCYCAFLRQVLTEFDRVLLEHSTTYYRRYRDHRDLFEEMDAVLGKEQSFMGMELNASSSIEEALRRDVDTYATKLGEEWRQFVKSAARDL